METENTELKDDIKKRFAGLQDRRKKYEADIIEANEFCLPRRSNWDIDSDQAPPIPKTFNSHANYALKVCAQGLESTMVSRAKPWFTVDATARDDVDMDEIPGALDWLELVSKRIHKKLAQSTFYQANSEAIPDGCSTGTAYTYSEMDPVTARVHFRALHPREMYIEEDQFGEVDTVFRRYNQTARQIIQTFGKDSFNQEFLDQAKLNPEKTIRMLHACYPRFDRDPGSSLASDMPVASVFIDLTNDKIVHIGGYNEMPYHVWRYIKNSDEVYGRSPAIDAMVDIKMAQQASKTRLNLAHMTSQPPWAVPEAVKDKFRLSPGGITYVTPDTDVPKPLQIGANYPINKDVIDELNNAIDNHFNVKFFLMISSQDREMTAYEASERKGEQAAILGAAIGRFESEMLQTSIVRVFGLMRRNGEIPPAPEGLAEHGATLTIKYTGMLAQLQARYYQSSGITESIQLFGALGQLAPQALDNYDLDEFTREATDGFGLSQKIKREQVDVKKIRQLRLQAQQAQQQQAVALATQQSAMQNADKLNQQVQPGTPLAAIAQSAGLNAGAVS